MTGHVGPLRDDHIASLAASRTRRQNAFVTDASEKICPTCGTTYPRAERFCPRDGSALRVESGAELVGSVIAERYHVTAKLGEGGMGQVYLAEHVKMGRKSAVKLMNPGLHHDADAISRFTREAANASRINHPNVAGIYDFGETSDGLIFLAMEFVEGESLTSLTQRLGALPPARAADITRQIADGLSAAHERGIVHRDLKPDNIMIAKGKAGADLVKVVDFGIAKAGSSDNQQVTRTGLSVGTPAYMSPEQFAGDTVDHTSDIYSLGLVTFAMLTGEMAFQGTSARELMVQRLSAEPRTLDQVRPDVAWPDSLLRVMWKVLAADARDRYQSATTFGEELVAAVAELPGGSSHATQRERTGTREVQPTRAPDRRKRAALALGGVAVLTIVAAIGLRTGGAAAPPVIAAAPRPTVDAGMVVIPAGTYSVGTDVPSLAYPRHTEQVRSFGIDRTEVTVGAYSAFVKATHAPSPWGDAMPDSALPVTRVRWGDAANYCAWKHASGGRLPTEVEWEAAARGVSGRRYPYGTIAQAVHANTASAARKAPVPVGSFPRGATPEGLQDMSGNVWEWTSSPLVAYAGGRPLADSLSRYRVIKGGAFDTNDDVASAATRGYLSATADASKLPNTGFRCAMPAAPVMRRPGASASE